MLHRPTRHQRRQAATRRQQRYRRRQRTGAMPIVVDVDGPIVGLLIATRNLAEADAGDRAKVAAALAAMLAEAAEKFP
jgi:hypothetical protein